MHAKPLTSVSPSCYHGDKRRCITTNHSLTLQDLQAQIRQHDHRPELAHAYFLKLIEEVGELSEAVRKGQRLAATGTIRGTVEEELCDVLYYVAALANIYGIDLAQAYQLKDVLNREKYGR